jgi:hypothetical protein
MVSCALEAMDQFSFSRLLDEQGKESSLTAFGNTVSQSSMDVSDQTAEVLGATDTGLLDLYEDRSGGYGSINNHVALAMGGGKMPSSLDTTTTTATIVTNASASRLYADNFKKDDANLREADAAMYLGGGLDAASLGWNSWPLQLQQLQALQLQH